MLCVERSKNRQVSEIWADEFSFILPPHVNLRLCSFAKLQQLYAQLAPVLFAFCRSQLSVPELHIAADDCRHLKQKNTVNLSVLDLERS